jgi:glucosamine kinase
LLLGIDGGATKCRARLCAPSGARLAESIAGPANIRLGLEASFSAILQAAGDCLAQAGLSVRDLPRIVACLALAGASETSDLAAARHRKHPFRHATIMTEARAACFGAHGGRDGGVIRPWVSRNTAAQLTPPAGAALDGALQVARASAESAAA